MNAKEWNERYPVGTPVFAYPGARPEDDPNAERIVTRTRSRAQLLEGHTDVVWVEHHGACIALTHVDFRDPRACTACGSLPEQWCPDCAACEAGCYGGHDDSPCEHRNASWGAR